MNFLKNFGIVFKMPSPEAIYLATNDLKHFTAFFKINKDGGYQILEVNFPFPPSTLLHQSYLLYISKDMKKQLKKKDAKFTLDDILNMSY